MTKKGWIITILWSLGAVLWTYGAIRNFLKDDSLWVFLGCVDLLVAVMCGVNALYTVKRDRLDQKIQELEDRFARVRREGTE